MCGILRLKFLLIQPGLDDADVKLRREIFFFNLERLLVFKLTKNIVVPSVGIQNLSVFISLKVPLD